MIITEIEEIGTDEPTGIGCLQTERGNLPLHRLAVRATITGLVARTEIVQGFRNPYDEPLEATYVFPLPDRGAVTAMTLTADGRTVVADLQERAHARQAYDDAIAAGQRASIAEEDRPDVFTMRVGNILPGERVEVALTTVAPLPYEDGEASFRFPLVVAPRYIPGRPLSGASAGDGWADDTDAVPDASRITPPVLLPGFPNPVELSIEVALDPAGLALAALRSSLHAVEVSDGVVRVEPGERLDRDFVLRFGYPAGGQALSVVPDPDGEEGTFQLTVLPPTSTSAHAKDVVLLLDRSGSMHGWKMVAARRAAARIVDSLASTDRFAVLGFDHGVEAPPDLPAGLVPATDRNRYRAVEHLARMDARGGTELLAPLQQALRMFGDDARDRVLVLVTDGQVGNEDQIVAEIAPELGAARVHTVGVDRAVNAGFLGRLAGLGGGRCELVESEDRLDAAMDAIHRRICAPAVVGLALAGDGVVAGSLAPARLPGLFFGVPLVVRGRYREALGPLTVTGTTPDGALWQTTLDPVPVADDALAALWARAALRDLEDQYAIMPSDELAQRIVATSLRFGVLCRFTAYVAVDSRVVAAGATPHRVIQPVELHSGWESACAPMAATFLAGTTAAPAAAPGGAAMRSMAKRSHRAVDECPPDPLVAARAQAADEARRLATGPGSELECRDALDDLATRLDALARHVEEQGGDARQLRDLLELLRDHTVPATERWRRVRAGLEEFATGATPPRQDFWKRG